eukprot:GHVR01092431.1.p1 GENE.GHVR01092431.1~~GHVR01092431.1.p1  ORF type:complete len:232 (+),score=103.43 GHVR01092431.1:71-766(+)
MHDRSMGRKTPRKESERGEIDTSSLHPEAAFFKFAGKHIYDVDNRERLDVVLAEKPLKLVYPDLSYGSFESFIDRLKRLRKEVPRTIDAVKAILAAYASHETESDTLQSKTSTANDMKMEAESQILKLADGDSRLRATLYGRKDGCCLHDPLGLNVGSVRQLYALTDMVCSHRQWESIMIATGDTHTHTHTQDIKNTEKKELIKSESSSSKENITHTDTHTHTHTHTHTQR